jgi:hypothetical protein
VTEAEWLACDDPIRMLGFLEGKASERKLRLFACAYCRLLWESMRDGRSRAAVETGERYADGLADYPRLCAARNGALRALDAIRRPLRKGWPGRSAPRALSAALCAHVAAWPDQPVRQVTIVAVEEAVAAAGAGAPAVLRDFARCVFGNPFRPVRIARSWLAWNGGTVRRLAEAIYDGRDFDRLPVLADALEDAGCSDPELLGHLRGPGPHARGCWAVDLLLRKE